MSRIGAVVLAIFTLSIASLFLGWITFSLANGARKQYRKWKEN